MFLDFQDLRFDDGEVDGRAGSGDHPASGSPNVIRHLVGFHALIQGFLEMSNVKVVDEMVNMITAQRAYELNSKSIQTSDSMLQVAVNLKR